MADTVPRNKRSGRHDISYETATWTRRGENSEKVKRYSVRPMRNGDGFDVVDSHDDVEYVAASNFKTEETAREWMRSNTPPW